ncbi:mucin-binding protein [Pediococcus pentosaceus]|uniref:mucin-binding protein n=1 Tax=Pediococcus pentosaceus TaxID=1255 RepID=UPI001330ADA5|nr:KxYKxGKxW signal peptide domain-containing protein [Pediococcus pentosaceus]
MSKRIIKANQKVLHDSMEEKKRFHLYKSGKLWLVAGLATLSFATGGLSSQLMPQSVHADVATSTAATKTDDSTTSSAASSAAPSAAALKTSVATSSATSSSASSEASSASSSEATSKATSKAADQNSSATSSSATSKANSSSASKASSAATTKSGSKATSAATKSVAATTNSSAVKKATTSAKSSAASSQELKTKFHLDDVATVKQTGNQLVFSVAANKKLTDEQYQAIVDYATRNHLKVKGLPKQSQATHKASAGTDLSNQFFAKHSMDKNAAHDGDSITLNGDVVTISLVTDVSHAHYLTHAETQKLYDYIKSKNLKVVDQTLVEYNSYYDAKGNLLSRNTDRSNYEGDFATIEYRCSDPLIGLFYQAGKENSRFWKDTKWYQDILDSRDGHWQIAGGEDNTSDDFVDNDLGLMFSHTINGAAASDSFIIATELKDESTSFYIDNGDGTKLDLFNDNGDGTKLDLFNDRDDVTNTISWSRTGENDGPAGFYHYAGERTAYIFSADQVNEFIRAQAYAYEHEDDGATLNGQQIDGQEAGRHNAIIQPLNTTNKYQVNQIINIYDADGNLLYYVTELATGGEIIVNSDATIADLINTADDVSAKGNYDITDVFDNFANGLNGDGTKGDGIRYRVNDGKTPSNDPKGTGTGAYSGNYADSLADGVPDIDYYMIEQADATITYVDDDKDGAQVGDPVKVTGDIDTDKTETITIPDGYEYVGTDGKVSADGKTVTITLTDDDSDNVTVHLKHHLTPVTPDDPSDPNYDATHATSHETIHYVDENGDQVFEDGGGELNFTRTVTIDDVTNEVVEYGEWAPVTDGEFPAVTSPDKDGYTPDYPEVDAQTPDMTDGPDGTVKDIEVTVTYKADPAEATVFYVDDDNEGNVVKIEITKGKTDGLGIYTVKIPDGYEYVSAEGQTFISCDGNVLKIRFTADETDNATIHLKHAHKDVDPSDPDDPYYDATHDTATQIIHYVGQNGKTVFTDNKSQTLDYERSVTIDEVTGEITGYGDWKAVVGDEFGSVTSPDKPGYDVDTKVVSGEKPGITNGKDGKVSDFETTVTYTDVDEDATITYVDDDKNGAQVGDIVTVTGKTDDSTTYTVTIPDGYEYVGTDGGVVSADGKTVTITFAADDSDNVVIHLKHGHKDVDPSDPDDPCYADTHATVTQTVHYRNGENGKQMQADTTNEVNFNRTVTIDSVTGEITHYGDWEAVGDDYFKDFDSSAFDGYFADVQHTSEVKGVEPEQGAVDDVTINYYATDQTVQPDDPKDNGDKVDPSNPNSPVYPAGVTDKDLNKTVTETIHYVDPETGKEVASDKTIVVHYTRVGHVIYNQDGTVKEVKYDDWVADGSFTDVDSPVVDGYFTDHSKAGAYTVGDNDDITNQGNFDTTVYYYKRDQPVDPSSPKNDGDKINPDDPFSPSYPDGVDYDDLNAEVKQEVHYVDQNGKELTGTYTITVHYTRTAVIHYDENGEVTGITYSDWDADGSFAAVQSPDIDGYFTLNTSVAGKTVTDPQNQADFSDTVIYYKTDQDVTPDDPKTPNTPVNPSDPDSPDYPDGVDYDDLNADVKETVHYVGENGNELAESYTKTVHYERTAHIKYDKDGNATVTYGDWTADGSFDAVQSPDVDGHFTLNKTVDGKTVTDPQHQADFEDTVIYYKSSQNVTPDDPKAPDTPINPSDPNSPVYPDGVDEDDLNQDVTETIHYIDAITGEELADTYTKTVHYTRNATVNYDANGNATVTYSDWTAQDSFGAVDSPDIDGYVADQITVSGREVNAMDNDFDITVNYYDNDQHVTPDSPKHNGDKIDPSNPNSPVFPAGVDESDLNKDVTETIHYVDENGNELADTYTKTVHYTRDAHVHYDADGNTTITYGDWVADGSFDAVNSPEIDGYVADQDVIAALDNPTDNVDIVVTYHHAEVAPTPAPKPAPAPTKTVTPAHVAKKAMQQQAPAKRLPQTGEEDNSSMSEVGILGLLAGSLGLFGLGKKRKRDGED